VTTNKGGRPPSPDALDDSYTFRTYRRVLRRFLALAGPSVLTQFMAWYIGDERAELPERPCPVAEDAA